MAINIYSQMYPPMRPQQNIGQVSTPEGCGLTNSILLHGLANGNPLAAKQFHLRYSARISRWVWRLLGTDLDHDDVVQQVFVNALDALHRIVDPDALDSWVDSVAIKTVRYEIRKRKIRRAFIIGRVLGVSEDTLEIQDPNSPFKQSHIKKLYELLDKMSANDRIILSLKYLEGYSVEQIAAVGNYSRSTAKRRLQKAKSRFIKKALNDFSLVSLLEG